MACLCSKTRKECKSERAKADARCSRESEKQPSPYGSSWTLLFWGPVVLRGEQAVDSYSHLMLHPVKYPKSGRDISLVSPFQG